MNTTMNTTMNKLALAETLEGKRPSRHRQSGLLTLGQALAVIAIGGIIIAFSIPRIEGMYGSTRIEQAFSELNDLIIATQRYRSVVGSYDTNLDIEELVDSGYGLAGYDDGTDENAYNLDITVARRAAGGATITYQFDNAPACEQMEARMGNINAVMATPAPACATNTLTFHIN